MPNEAIFNQSSGPLYTEQVNTYISPAIDNSPEADAALAGLLFSAPFASTVTTAAPLVIQLSNPAGSGRTAYVSRVTGSSAASAVTLSLLRNATVTGATTAPVNFNFGSATASVMTVRTATAAPTGSPATLIALLLAPGPTIVDLNGRIIVPPGSSVTLTMTIASGSSAATGSINWWEA
ncbi:hypothetical protein [Paenibacillus tengchongensis]|uniref:hypothetical protein n=1 Tax=Paenibacillus tengchongensis TaxID=2608684 RepID=UPI00124D1915|nr:hypothetical protein [Paenibacillus tengchongensis]